MNHDELALEQLALLRQQNQVLLNIATHTRLLHVLAWISLVGSVLAVIIAVGESSEEPGPVLVFLALGAFLIFAVARGVRNVSSVEPARTTEASTE